MIGFLRFRTFQSTVITIVPPVGPPVVVPVGRAVRNKGIEIDSRFKVIYSVFCVKLATLFIIIEVRRVL